MSAFLSAIGASAIIGFAAYICRESIREFVVRGIQHRFDERLAEVQSDFRKTEAQLSSELKKAEAQIGTLQSGAVAAVSARQAALDKRRFEAVDQLWRAIVALTGAKAMASFVSIYNLDAVIKHSKESKPLQQIFKSYVVAEDKLQPMFDARLVQPFVSQTAWNLFSAYSATLSYAQAAARLVSLGVGDPKFLKDEAVIDSMKAALPGYSTYIDEYRVGACFLLLDQVEADLVLEIRRWFDDPATDEAAIKRSVEVTRLVTNALREAEENANALKGVPEDVRFATPLPRSN